MSRTHGGVDSFSHLRDRAKAAIEWYGPARAFATAGSILVVCVGAWWLLRAPAPPLENSLPFAGTNATATLLVPADAVLATLPSASSAARDITVHVVGAVVAPGVYTLVAGSRVVDAVEAAGGATSGADLPSVNMALPLADADQVFIPSKGVAPRASGTPHRSTPSTLHARPNPTHPTVPQAIAAATTTSFTGGSVTGGGLVDINTADAAQLEKLPGVGPSTAKAIIAHRQTKGPFAKIEDLMNVKGIGEGKFGAMKAFVTT